MTTPRVTVPVEPVPNMPTVDWSDDSLVKIASGEVVTWGEAKRRLSAAPAPDAGAVWKAHHGDTPLQGAAREAGWALSSMIDSAPWERRGQLQRIVERLGAAIDRLVWPWPGDDVRHGEIRDAWRAYADDRTDDDGKIDATEIETCVAIGCMKTIQLLSSSATDTLAQRVCKICDGGPGNEGPCLCGMKAWVTQPQARGDAQPFMFAYEDVDKPGEWRAFRHQIKHADGSICPGRPLYTHPAPDALRLAMEALEAQEDQSKRGILFMTCEEVDRVTTLRRQALAALQAEQKGGA